MAEARRTIFGIKLSKDGAARCDAARGDVPRSEWGRELLLAALDAPVNPLPAESSRKPASHRCPVKGWCEECGEWKGAKR